MLEHILTPNISIYTRTITMTTLALLPYEILYVIIHLLPFEDVRHLSHTCKLFRDFCTTRYAPRYHHVLCSAPFRLTKMWPRVIFSTWKNKHHFSFFKSPRLQCPDNHMFYSTTFATVHEMNVFFTNNDTSNYKFRIIRIVNSYDITADIASITHPVLRQFAIMKSQSPHMDTADPIRLFNTEFLKYTPMIELHQYAPDRDDYTPFANARCFRTMIYDDYETPLDLRPLARVPHLEIEVDNLPVTLASSNTHKSIMLSGAILSPDDIKACATSATHIRLNLCTVDDYTPLNNTPTLQLQLTHQPSTFRLTNVQHLSLSVSFDINCALFCHIPTIDLSNNRLDRLKNLHTLGDTDTLYLRSVHLHDVSWVRTVRVLDVSHNDIVTVSALGRVHELNLFANCIHDVAPLKDVHTLVLSNGWLNNIETLTKAHTLILARCLSVTSVVGFEHVHTIDLSGTEVTDVSPLKNVVKLKFISHTTFKIGQHPRLKELYVKMIGARMHRAINALPALEFLWVARLSNVQTFTNIVVATGYNWDPLRIRLANTNGCTIRVNQPEPDLFTPYTHRPSYPFRLPITEDPCVCTSCHCGPRNNHVGGTFLSTYQK
jgi:hypothetical protein